LISNQKKQIRFIALIFCLLQFSLFGASDELFSYANIKSAIASKNLALIFEIKDKLEEKFSDYSLEDALSKPIERLLKTDIFIPSEEIKRIKSTLNQPTIGEFLGALFFPYSSFENTVKTNFNQFSFFERALVLISADLGFKPARNIIVLGNNEKVNLSAIRTEQDLYQLLSIPFAAENGMVIRKAKEILNDASKQDAFWGSLSAADPIVLVNAGYVYKFIERNDVTLNLFERAADHGARRGAIEFGFLMLEKDLTRAEEFVASLSTLGMEHYALWKLAQYYRYGASTSRDVATANSYYLRALPGGTEFPEIFYDAGDFTEYFAYSLTDKTKMVKALEQAQQHYHLAAEGGIGEGYRKQVEIMRKIGILRSTDVEEETIRVACMAANNYFIDALVLLGEKSTRRIPKTEEWRNLEECISFYFNLLKYIKKWSISF